jgi:nicotinate dehydrogenase subunit B
MTDLLTEKEFSRSDFLKGSGALVVGFSVPMTLARKAAAATGAAGAIGPALIDPKLVDSWIAIDSSGKVTVLTGKVELGTGILTATMQIAAEELDVAFSSVRIVEGDTWRTPDQGTTAGSQSTKTQWANGVRQAAAEARAALLAMASKRLGVPAAQLTVTGGVVSVASDSSRKVSYGELIGGQRFNLTVTGKAPTKKPSEHKIVGKSIKRPEVPSKLNGRFTYLQDVKIAGMLHGRVVRPPSINATLVSVNGFKKKVAGLVKVVVQKDYVGVVCEREEQAIEAAKNLRVTWKDPGGINSIDQFWAAMESQEGRARLLVADGDVEQALKGAAKVVEATYYYPYQLHGSMGPSCSVADVKGDEATVWSPTQGVYPLRSMIAKFLGLKDQAVHVIYVEGPGCYGLNGADSASLDAVIMSKAVGRPVRVQWMRADEHEWEHFGQPMVMKAKGGLDAAGNLIAWDYQAWTAGRGGRPGNVGAANLPPGYLTGLPLPPTRPTAPTFPPLGADNSNTVAGYLQDEEGRLKNARVIARAVDSPFFTGPLRSPARIQNTFANESFIDELAAAAGADPVEFRLRYVGDERLAEVIRRAAARYGWQSRPSPKSSRNANLLTGRGIGAMQYEGEDGYAATIAEVRVNRKTGKVTVTRMVVAHDVGIIINPDGIRLQIEGNVVQGISRTLKEEVKIKNGRATTKDWEGYSVFRFTDMPKVDIELINRPNQPAVGTGENAMTNMPAAIANAIFDATGARLRRLPFTPARVKAALG